MTFCYALAGEPGGLYAKLTCISLWFLRRLHPDANVVLACDSETYSWASKPEYGMPQRFQEILKIETNTSNRGPSSRILKMSLRTVLSGDFVYLDVDALPVRPLDGMFGFKEPVAAAMDLNASPAKSFPESQEDNFRKLGWPRPRRYFNAGVIVWRDVPEAHEFAREWRRRWEISMQLGTYEDQLAFNSAIDTDQFSIGTLPHYFNAMLNLSRAKVIHFFCGKGAGPEHGTVLHALLQAYRDPESFPPDLVDTFLRTRYPWLNPYSIRKQWVCGHYIRAASVAMQKSLSYGRRRLAEAPKVAP